MKISPKSILRKAYPPIGETTLFRPGLGIGVKFPNNDRSGEIVDKNCLVTADGWLIFRSTIWPVTFFEDVDFEERFSGKWEIFSESHTISQFFYGNMIGLHNYPRYSLIADDSLNRLSFEMLSRQFLAEQIQTFLKVG